MLITSCDQSQLTLKSQGSQSCASRPYFLRRSSRIYFFSLSVPLLALPPQEMCPHTDGLSLPDLYEASSCQLTHPFHYDRISHNATYTPRVTFLLPFSLKGECEFTQFWVFLKHLGHETDI